MNILISAKNLGKIRGAKEVFVKAFIQYTNEVWNEKVLKNNLN